MRVVAIDGRDSDVLKSSMSIERIKGIAGINEDRLHVITHERILWHGPRLLFLHSGRHKVGQNLQHPKYPLPQVIDKIALATIPFTISRTTIGRTTGFFFENNQLQAKKGDWPRGST